MKAIRDVLTLDLPLERSAEHWRERECSPQYMRMGRLVGGLLASARAALEVGADAAVLRVLLRSPLLRDPKHVLAPAVVSDHSEQIMLASIRTSSAFFRCVEPKDLRCIICEDARGRRGRQTASGRG